MAANETSPSLALLLSFALACGCSSSSEPSTEIDSGVANETLVNELSQDEANAMCKAFYAVVDENQATTDSCANTAYLQASRVFLTGEHDEEELRESCRRELDYCEEAMTEEEDEAIEPERCTMQMTKATCAATVGEIETCWSALLEYQFRVFEAPSDCETLTLAEMEEFSKYATVNAEADATSSACAPARENCPDGF